MTRAAPRRRSDASTEGLELPEIVRCNPRALRAGTIPGSVKFPVYGLYMDHARIKPPEQLLYALKNRGITPEKTVILTCNTGAWAGAGFFMLRYLGFPDVRMHDASWVGFERFVRYPQCRY